MLKKLFILLGTFFLLLSIFFTVIAIKSARDFKGKAASPAFQPTAPFYATFFYPWYKNPNTDGSWAHWEEAGHNPPQNWGSNYIPDPNPSAFDPANELYSSKNDSILNWQLQKMAEAKIEVAISSWWGVNDNSDLAFSHIIKNVMNRSSNPYPNLRWTLLYEKEGYSDPSVTQILSDLSFIQNQYGSQKGTLQIGGKQVIFVYTGSANPLDVLSRWGQVRSQTNFHIVMQAFPGFEPYTSQMDGWFQYNPTLRGDSIAPYFSFVSPGFWKIGQSAVLTRNLSEFNYAVSLMVLSNTTWKLVETWNEWNEGTSVEPGEQVIQTSSGFASLHPNGVPFKNQYIDVLKNLLPSLEADTGVVSSSSPDPESTQTQVNAQPNGKQSSVTTNSSGGTSEESSEKANEGETSKETKTGKRQAASSSAEKAKKLLESPKFVATAYTALSLVGLVFLLGTVIFWFSLKRWLAKHNKAVQSGEEGEDSTKKSLPDLQPPRPPKA